MMYDDAIQQALATKTKTEVVVVKIGTVTSVSGGRAYVQHYGDSTPSSKQYTYIDGYMPEVGDKVAMLPQGNTYIILGKISDSAPDPKFLPIEYKNKLEQEGGETLTFDSNAFVPATNNADDIGSGTKYFKTGYFMALYLNGAELKNDRIVTVNSGTTYSLIAERTSYSNVDLDPSTADLWNLGRQRKMKEIYASYICGDLRHYTSSLAYQSIVWDNNYNFSPSTDNTISLGTSSKQYKNIYGKNLYANGTAVTSDFRKKKDIKSLGHRFVEFFKNLRPVSFRYKDGTSGRRHTGFIAQEVEEAVKEAGMTDLDMAVVVKDAAGEYYLRYDELIAVQTKAIQELMAKVDSLEARIKVLENR